VAKLKESDWGKIHAMAWRDPKFRTMLESNPTAAVREYEKSIGKARGYFDKIVSLPRSPSKKAIKSMSETELQSIAPWPPWCC
jgi:hypothetical protein